MFSQIPLEEEGLSTVRADTRKCFQCSVTYVVGVSIAFERESLWAVITWIFEFTMGKHMSCQGTRGI